MAITAWPVYPYCPNYFRKDVEARVRSFPPAFLKEPVDGEVFDNIKYYQERL
jgi:hypothetical protein